MRRKILRTIGKLAALIVALGLSYGVLLVYPAPLFAHALDGTTITLRSDEPLPPGSALVVARAESLIEQAQLFDATRHHDVHLCQRGWRWRLMSNAAFGAGAVAFAPFGRSVFVRRSIPERDVMLRSDGTSTGADRPLSYYLAHEITHTMTADYLGARDYYALPAWVREGYADLVARGPDFDHEAALRGYFANERDLDPSASGLYLRYALLVRFVLVEEGQSLATLLRTPPLQRDVEARFRAAHAP